VSADDYVYIFHHIPRCGGTSMREAFKQWFRCKVDYRSGWGMGARWERFRRRPLRLETLPPGTMICGHFEVDGIFLHQRYPQVLKDPRYRLISFVRDPFDLRLSLLRYEIEHQRLTGEESIERLLSDRPNWLCERFRCLADDMETILSRYFFIGITEESQASFDRLADKLGKPRVRLPSRNGTEPRGFPVDEERMAQFRQVHDLDYRLYHRCLERWQEVS
jgi:hypothetical protein